MLQKAALNNIQADILRRLRKLSPDERLRFAEINVDSISSDQFSYPLRQLQRSGLVIKHPDNTYSLSVEGKSSAPLIAPHDNRLASQGYVATRIVLTREEDGQQEFLLQERSVNPQRGMWSTPGGKIASGTTTDYAARHYLQRQTGLKCDVTLAGIAHFIDEYCGSVVQDRYFFVFLAANPVGDLITEGPRGKNVWVSYADIQHSPQALPGLLSIIDMSSRSCLSFEEQRFVLKDF